jgi:hypothetical protein
MDAVSADTLINAAQHQKVERGEMIFLAKKQARVLEKKLLVSEKHRNVNAALRNVCFVLHDLVQRYVMKAATAQRDYATFVYCGHILKEMGLRPKTNPVFDQSAEDLRLDVIRSSFEYRNIRNKLLASLAIIADLPERSVGNGSPEYQRGMREGYRRASEIAILFLEDLSSEG